MTDWIGIQFITAIQNNNLTLVQQIISQIPEDQLNLNDPIEYEEDDLFIRTTVLQEVILTENIEMLDFLFLKGLLLTDVIFSAIQNDKFVMFTNLVSRRDHYNINLNQVNDSFDLDSLGFAIVKATRDISPIENPQFNYISILINNGTQINNSTIGKAILLSRFNIPLINYLIQNGLIVKDIVIGRMPLIFRIIKNSQTLDNQHIITLINILIQNRVDVNSTIINEEEDPEILQQHIQSLQQQILNQQQLQEIQEQILNQQQLQEIQEQIEELQQQLQQLQGNMPYITLLEYVLNYVPDNLILDIFRILVNAGVKLDHIHNGNTILYNAIDQGNVDVVQFLAQHKKINVNYINNNDKTPLIYSLEKLSRYDPNDDIEEYDKFKDIIKILLENNAYYIQSLDNQILTLFPEIQEYRNQLAKTLVQMKTGNILVREGNKLIPRLNVDVIRNILNNIPYYKRPLSYRGKHVNLI